MKTIVWGPLALALTLLGTGELHAQSVEEQEAWERQQDYADRQLEQVETSCGIKPKFSFEKSSWWKARGEWSDFSPNGRCSDVATALTVLCKASERNRAAVAKNVREIRCGLGGRKTGFKFSLKGGVIEYFVEVERANVGDEIQTLLKRAM